MIRRLLGLPLVALLVLALAPTARAADADVTPPLDADTMKAALRTATEEEDGFVERALKASHDGKLPAGMLESTFQWARRKQSHQFQYFKQALTLRAQEVGVSLEKPTTPSPPEPSSPKHSFLDVFRWMWAKSTKVFNS